LFFLWKYFKGFGSQIWLCVMASSRSYFMVRYAFVKLGMTSIFTDAGEAKGVTVLKLQPAKVLRHEKLEDGRTLAVVEYDVGNRKKLVRGYVVKNPADYEVGSTLKAPAFESGKTVKVTGFSKGRGFQDVITRHGFSGGPAAHGSRFHRAPGSIGMRTQPGRTPKGRKLPGQDGNVQVSIKSAQVAYWSADESIVAVVGGVPGASGRVVFI
jgi:large subunit ribosomal protein L3